MKGTCGGCDHAVQLLRWYHGEGAAGLVAEHNNAKTGNSCKGSGAPPLEAKQEN